MNASSFDILIPSISEDKLEQLENAILFTENIFKKSKEEFKIMFCSNDSQSRLAIKGKSLQIERKVLEAYIIELEKKPNKILLFPIEKIVKRYTKPVITEEHNLIFNSCCPVLTYNNIQNPSTIKNIIVPIALNEDFMPIIMKVLKFMKNLKSATLHIVSVLQNSNDYNLNKATQQLSFLHDLFFENDVKYTAEIINSQNNLELKSDIVLDHIKRVNADLVVLYKNHADEKISEKRKVTLLDIISKSEVPIITFI